MCCVRKHALPCQVNMCFLHDSEPGQQRLQVVLTGQVVIQGLRTRDVRLDLMPKFPLWLYQVKSSLTVMICALSSGDSVAAFGFPLNSLWKACMALAVTNCRQKHKTDEINIFGT